ncbi:MAG: cytochrome c oxidase subunit 3 family protein [Planctomycetes bacterium]|nr:cytochrome c oxidase subunit 3 family protein [Planctomycetota bacterium]
MSHGPIVQTPTPEGFRPHVVAHHFHDANQEFHSVKLGFWLFLATEVMLFGGVFAAYFIFHGQYPETFVKGGEQLSVPMGSLNTVILLTSSWTMAMGVRACQLSQKKQMLGFLWVTLLCAGGFLVVKYFEYTAKIEHGLLPGSFWHPHGHYAEEFANVEWPNLFFSFYWTMTGIHGVHVILGMLAISWLIWQGGKGRFHSGFSAPVDLIGLYWHIVDLIWIFLFPLLYLVP